MGILYGHRCVLCGADFPVTTSRTLQLCPDCAAAVRREYRCTEVISIAGADGTIAPLYYRGTVRNAMKRFKFSSAAYCADWFAAQMSVALTSQLDDWQPDLITYMPIGFLHYRKRGYNQAELLAKLVAKPLSLPCEAALRKRWFVKKQSAQKDYAARQSNAKDAVLPKKGVNLTGKSVVLVDDIITTGATAAGRKGFEDYRACTVQQSGFDMNFGHAVRARQTQRFCHFYNTLLVELVIRNS